MHLGPLEKENQKVPLAEGGASLLMIPFKKSKKKISKQGWNKVTFFNFS